MTLAVVAPLGGLIYTLAFRSIAGASILTLLIVAVGVHLALLGLGLLIFGPEGYRIPEFWIWQGGVGDLMLTGSTVLVFATTGLVICGM